MHSSQTSILLQKVEDFQTALDYVEFELKKSLIIDIKKSLLPNKINDKVFLLDIKDTGILTGFEFDIFNRPLLVVNRIKKNGEKSVTRFSKAYELHEVEFI